MLKIFRQLIFTLAVASPAIQAAELEHLQGLGDVRYHLSQSEQIGRDFHIYVMLPDDYADSTDHYPTIYLLDGGNLFPMLTPYYRYLNFGEEIPKTIIVGISYGSEGFETGNLRSTDYTAPSDERDYWGGAAKFQTYLEDTLLPFIEEQYRSNADRRVIFGQSLGGQFAIYTALTRPNLFWGHIASNPALHRNLDYFLTSRAETNASKKLTKLFVGSGTLDDPTFRKPAVDWINYWNSAEKKPWQLKTVDLDGHSHMSAPPASFRQGLRWLFSKELGSE